MHTLPYSSQGVPDIVTRNQGHLDLRVHPGFLDLIRWCRLREPRFRLSYLHYRKEVTSPYA